MGGSVLRGFWFPQLNAIPLGIHDPGETSFLLKLADDAVEIRKAEVHDERPRTRPEILCVLEEDSADTRDVLAGSYGRVRAVKVRNASQATTLRSPFKPSYSRFLPGT